MLLTALLLQAAACPAMPAPPPAELAGWATKTPVAATATGEATLTVGQGVRAGLLPGGSVRLAVAPGRPAKAGSHDGVFAFDAPAAGRYRVALGGPAWVDVVADGKALASVAHGHGPACSGIRKMVDFDLKPGSYRLQVVGSAAPSVDLMVARLR